jgi:hypothetical protein
VMGLTRKPAQTATSPQPARGAVDPLPRIVASTEVSSNGAETDSSSSRTSC